MKKIPKKIVSPPPGALYGNPVSTGWALIEEVNGLLYQNDAGPARVKQILNGTVCRHFTSGYLEATTRPGKTLIRSDPWLSLLRKFTAKYFR